MIHKDWKKRLKSLKKAKELHLIIGGMITLPALITWVITGEFTDVLILSGLIFGLGGFVTYIAEVFFAENSSLDDTVVQTLQNKQKKENENHHTQYPKQMWEKNKVNMWNVARNTVLSYDIVDLNIAISYILKNATLSLEEKKYFAQDFPNEMIEIVTMYQELQGEHRERMKTLIQKEIKQKKKEWEQVYIEPLQNKLEEACGKKVQQTFQKQQEHIYINE